MIALDLAENAGPEIAIILRAILDSITLFPLVVGGRCPFCRQ